MAASDVPDGMGACLDNLMTSFLNEQPECDATEVYVKCLLKVLGADPFTMTQHNMKNLETGIKKEKSKYKLNCDLDITKIIEVLKYDKEMNLNQNHKPPHTDYRKATGIGECMDIMARRNANVDEGYCQLYDPLVTCVVRVINNNKIDMDKVNEHYRIIHNIFLEQLFAMGSECNIEIPTLFTNADYKQNDNS